MVYVKKPLRHQQVNYVSQAIIYKASANLSNIALHKAYAKQKRLSTLFDSWTWRSTAGPAQTRR